MWRCATFNCIIEGRRVAAVVSHAAPLASAVPGAEGLRTSSAFRNTFHRRPEGWAL
jgi:hypothetical protein